VQYREETHRATMHRVFRSISRSSQVHCSKRTRSGQNLKSFLLSAESSWFCGRRLLEGLPQSQPGRKELSSTILVSESSPKFEGSSSSEKEALTAMRCQSTPIAGKACQNRVSTSLSMSSSSRAQSLLAQPQRRRQSDEGNSPCNPYRSKST